MNDFTKINRMIGAKGDFIHSLLHITGLLIILLYDISVLLFSLLSILLLFQVTLYFANFLKYVMIDFKSYKIQLIIKTVYTCSNKHKKHFSISYYVIYILLYFVALCMLIHIYQDQGFDVMTVCVVSFSLLKVFEDWYCLVRLSKLINKYNIYQQLFESVDNE